MAEQQRTRYSSSSSSSSSDDEGSNFSKDAAVPTGSPTGSVSTSDVACKKTSQNQSVEAVRRKLFEDEDEPQLSDSVAVEKTLTSQRSVHGIVKATGRSYVLDVTAILYVENTNAFLKFTPIGPATSIENAGEKQIAYIIPNKPARHTCDSRKQSPARSSVGSSKHASDTWTVLKSPKKMLPTLQVYIERLPPAVISKAVKRKHTKQQEAERKCKVPAMTNPVSPRSKTPKDSSPRTPRTKKGRRHDIDVTKFFESPKGKGRRACRRYSRNQRNIMIQAFAKKLEKFRLPTLVECRNLIEDNIDVFRDHSNEMHMYSFLQFRRNKIRDAQNATRM